MADQVGYSLSNLELERDELRKDLVAFVQAYDIIRRRVFETSEEHPSRGMALERWCGTWAAFGTLELASKQIESKILELEELIKKVQSGEATNLDKKKLEIVKEESR